jgi:ATP-dependent protease ClpP protease subunit
MPDFNGILDELTDVNVDSIRKKYLSALSGITHRNTIAYYSGWLQKQVEVPEKVSISDADMTGFMSCIHNLDKEKGLDLILHTPGGEVNATEALVTYLRSCFGTNIRAFIPHLAMSAGTMISLSCREIWLGKHSSIGAIDPQVNGVPAHGIMEEWEKSRQEITNNPVLVNVWEPILRKYHPTFVGQCEKAIKMADKIVRSWLDSGALSHHPELKRPEKIDQVMQELGEHKMTLNHGRHVGFERAKELGLNVYPIESDPNIQEAVLSVHHAFCATLYQTPAIKIIQNQVGQTLVLT